MGGRKLNTFVHVVEIGPDGKQTGQAGMFGPDDTLPDWAEASITNPKVWADDSPTPLPRREPAPVVTAPAATGQAPAEGEGQGPVAGGGAVKVPPRGGAGSGREDWAAYATANGLEVTDDMKSRDDIIAALDAAGIATK